MKRNQLSVTEDPLVDIFMKVIYERYIHIHITFYFLLVEEQKKEKGE